MRFATASGRGRARGSVRAATAPVSAHARVSSAEPLRWCCHDGGAVADGGAAGVSGGRPGRDAVAPARRGGDVYLQPQGARSPSGQRAHQPVAHPTPGVRADDVDVSHRVRPPVVGLGAAQGDAIRGGVAGLDAARTGDGEVQLGRDRRGRRCRRRVADDDSPIHSGGPCRNRPGRNRHVADRAVNEASPGSAAATTAGPSTAAGASVSSVRARRRLRLRHRRWY